MTQVCCKSIDIEGDRRALGGGERLLRSVEKAFGDGSDWGWGVVVDDDFGHFFSCGPHGSRDETGGFVVAILVDGNVEWGVGFAGVNVGGIRGELGYRGVVDGDFDRVSGMVGEVNGCGLEFSGWG